MAYYPALDGLRGLAVLLVVGLHASYGHAPGGALGVDIFFVLSGFLITRVLLRPEETLTTFYIRRAQRLLPALVCSLILAFILWPFTNPLLSYLRAVLPAALYFADFQSSINPGVMGSLLPTWSLSIEEQFYVVWPFALMAITKISRQNRPFYTLTLVGVFTVLKICAYFTWPAAASYYSPLNRVDVLLLGCTLGVSERPGRWPIAAYVFLASIPILVFRLSSNWRLYSVVAAPLIACGSVSVIAECLAGDRSLIQRVLSLKPLVWIGRRSYGIYLYHLPLFLALENLRRAQSKTNFIAITGARLVSVVIVAAVSYRFVERPILAMRFGKRVSSNLAIRDG